MQETNIPPELRERFEKILYQYDIGNMSMVELLFAAYNMDRNEWVEIREYPSNNPVVERWHKIYNCVISVCYKENISKEKDCNWITATLDNSWPEAAFYPIFKLPQPPNQK